ncbi:MAG TPA: ACT domain-containing protein [Anaerolineae bacterium]|nr:ACT domain-containing protein [Anaerolineae bacterium]
MDVQKVKAGGIICTERLAKIGVMSAPDRPGLASAVLRALGDGGVNAEFIVQCIDLEEHSHVILCVAEEDLDTALAALEGLKAKVKAKTIISHPNVALVSVFGPDFRERPAIAAKVFEAMASAGINIMAISTSISTVSCLIDGNRVDDAAVALREHFALP